MGDFARRESCLVGRPGTRGNAQWEQRKTEMVPRSHSASRRSAVASSPDNMPISALVASGTASSKPFFEVFLPDSGNPNATHVTKCLPFRKMAAIKAKKLQERFNHLHQWRTTDILRLTAEQRLRSERLGATASVAPPQRNRLSRTIVAVSGRSCTNSSDTIGTKQCQEVRFVARQHEGQGLSNANRGGQRAQSALGTTREKQVAGTKRFGALGVLPSRPQTSLSSVSQRSDSASASALAHVQNAGRHAPTSQQEGEWVWVRVPAGAPKGTGMLSNGSKRPVRGGPRS
jgi:hypothetical protein